jgi:hypothetical protein
MLRRLHKERNKPLFIETTKTIKHFYTNTEQKLHVTIKVERDHSLSEHFFSDS